jgi:hypothetical protein
MNGRRMQKKLEMLAVNMRIYEAEVENCKDNEAETRD